MDPVERDWLTSAERVKATADRDKIEFFEEDAEEAHYAGDISYETLQEIRKILSLLDS